MLAKHVEREPNFKDHSMGMRKALVVLGMLAFSWLLVIGAIYSGIELYHCLLP